MVEMGGEQLQNLEGDPITSEILTQASGFLGHFYKATEVTVATCNVYKFLFVGTTISLVIILIFFLLHTY